MVRKSGFKSDAGLIKIELESETDVKRVLREKCKLRESAARELREVYLRQSKSEERLVSE